MVTKINKEIKTKNLTKMKRCKAGLEVHFKEAEGRNVSKTSTTRRKKRKREANGDWCFICIKTKTENWRSSFWGVNLPKRQDKQR